MTSTVRRMMAAAAAASCMLAVPGLAAAQSERDHPHASSGPARQDCACPMASPSADREALDARIRALASDMRMFTGDLKVDAMAALLTTLIERQALVEAGMRTMHDGMMKRMAERGVTAPAVPADGADRPSMMQRREQGARMMQRQAAPAAPADPSPEEMCAPEN